LNASILISTYDGSDRNSQVCGAADLRYGRHKLAMLRQIKYSYTCKKQM
jgi:hypothetical protein